MKRVVVIVAAWVMTVGAMGHAAEPATRPGSDPVLASPPPHLQQMDIQLDERGNAFINGQPDGKIMIQGQPGMMTMRAVKMEKAAFLGIVTTPVMDEALRDQLKLAKGMGLVVEAVEKGSPAEAAGIQVHDVLVKLDDQKLVNPPQLEVLVRALKPGDTVALAAIHESKAVTYTAKLVEKEVPALEVSGVKLLIRNGDGPGDVMFMAAPQAQTQQAQPPAGPHVRVFQNGGGVSSSTSVSSDANGRRTATRTEKNHDGSFTLTTVDGQKSFVAKDAEGKVLFDGPVNTEEERKAVPAELRPKLEAMEGK